MEYIVGAEFDLKRGLDLGPFAKDRNNTCYCEKPLEDSEIKQIESPL